MVLEIQQPTLFQDSKFRDSNGSGDFVGATITNAAGSNAKAGVAFKGYDWVQGGIYHHRGASALTLATNPNTSDLSAGGLVPRLNIDNAGRVTKPYHPYASASSSSQTSANQTIPLNASNVYNGGMNIDNTNQRFTVPIAGHYVVGYHHLAETTGTVVIVRKNGSNINGLHTQAQVSSNGNFSAQGILALAANDYIDFRVNSGRTHGNSQYNTMYLYLIG